MLKPLRISSISIYTDKNGSSLTFDTNRYRSGLLVPKTDPSSLRFRLRPAGRDFAETSRRDKPGWSRSIRPMIIHAPSTGVAAFGRKPHFYRRRSAETPLRQKLRLGDSITDGAYAAMMNAIRHDETPNFYFMQYELATWRVKNLLLVPSFAFPPSAIIKRKPLSPTARRAGWIGCNFALNRILADARIAVVTEKNIIPEAEVREKFRRVKPLKDISVTQRGWTLDVLNTIRHLVESRRRGNETPIGKSGIGQSLLTSAPKTEFTTADAYAFTRELEKLHPDNRHIKDKIRQQLQVLRDAGLLLHVVRLRYASPRQERGSWRLP